MEQGRCFIEDLGSSLGTYWNQERIPPNQRRLCSRGTRSRFFPTVYGYAPAALGPRADVSVYAGARRRLPLARVLETSTSGRTVFAIQIHPLGEPIVLEISRSYLMDLADRVLRPLDITGPPSIMGATDGAFLEFLMLCLVERVNRDLAFPFQFEVARFGTMPDIPQEARGISVACSVSLLAATGALRVFIPYASLEGMRHAFPGLPASGGAPGSSWKFPVSIGSATLAARDVAGLEREDVLIFEPALELLFPHRFDRGWKALPPAGLTNYPQQIRNLNRLLIDIYFERESLKINDSKAANPPEPNRAPDLNDLPVRLHVILAEKELTLAEAAGLAKGSIVELDGAKNGVVSLAVNGKVLGEGQLVEVEGRLGVKILSWRGA